MGEYKTKDQEDISSHNAMAKREDLIKIRLIHLVVISTPSHNKNSSIENP